MTTILKPGILVSLKTTLEGGSHYYRKDLAGSQPNSIDPRRSVKWETTRVIDDPDEYNRAVNTRASASALIRGVCVHTAFGLLCPSDRENELAAAVEQARALVSAHNDSANATSIRVYVLKGRIASTDTEAEKAIASEVSGLLAQMQDGIAGADPKSIREAANRARALGAILDGKQAELVSDAIKAAREAATEIVKRVVKAGEDTQAVIAGLDAGPIAAARFAFLDVDDVQTTEPAPALPAIAVQRFADFDDEDPTPVEPAYFQAEAV